MDIIKRDDIRGIYPTELDGRIARAIGTAVCGMLCEEGEKAPLAAIGHDCRHGGTEIAQGFALGFIEGGGKVRELGLVSTEHVYYACGECPEYAVGVMVTASHNPREYNGLKLLHRGCVPFTSDDLSRIGRALNTLPKEAPLLDLEEYASRMLKISGLEGETFLSSSCPFRVAVLAGGGMGGLAFRPISERLRAYGLENVFFEESPDGDFPRGVPNPLLPGFMERLSEAVHSCGADLGIGFDGDADRAGFADASGAQIIPSQVLGLIAGAKLANSVNPEPVIMRNICCSQLLRHLFPEGGKVTLVDTPVGHGRIKQLMRSERFRTRTLFAGEHSGHYFYPEFHYVDSGVLSALNMLRLAWSMKQDGISLHERLKPWRANYAWSGEVNFVLPAREHIFPVMRSICDTFMKPGVSRVAIQCDGGLQIAAPATGDYCPEELPAPDLKLVRDAGDSGWWLVLRPSGNEPKLRLNVEAWGEGCGAASQALTDDVANALLRLGAVRK